MRTIASRIGGDSDEVKINEELLALQHQAKANFEKVEVQKTACEDWQCTLHKGRMARNKLGLEMVRNRIELEAIEHLWPLEENICFLDASSALEKR